MRHKEPGYVKIGITCKAGRRSLWFRENWREGANENVKEVGDLLSFELCAGREGDDSYVKVENDGSKQFYDLWDVLSTAMFAGEEWRT